MKLSHILYLVLFVACRQPIEHDLTTVFEKSNGTKSANYWEGINWWKSLATNSAYVQMQEFGMTDAGYPLHIITLSKEGLSLNEVKTSTRATLFINNAIHPGEPDGVDASMLVFRDIAKNSSHLLDSCILVCIPYYNIGGAINRNGTSRANQNGPEEYGFRGNAQNLDLNRDFVKCDSKNAESFAKLLQVIDPDLYIETHVSNGADYQYNLTYLSTQPDKLGYKMGPYLRNQIIPSLETKMEKRNNEMVPYVNHWGGPLDTTYATFYDSPRYSSGLTTLHNIFGFITETHMLKDFKARVNATYDFLNSSITYCFEKNSEIQNIRDNQKRIISNLNSMPIDWEVDRHRSITFKFKGYEYNFKPSEVSGKERLYYDTTKPIMKNMKFLGYMHETKRRLKPSAYILKRGFIDVEERLKWNGVILEELQNDTVIEVISKRILDYETSSTPYEKHYYHYNTNSAIDTVKWQFRKGDFLIKTGTDKDRFLLEMLEPSAPDSYFNWNFFDAILQQKEHFSEYVFEDKAAAILKLNPILKAKFDAHLKSMSEASVELSAQEQLEWVYKNSDYYEKEHMRLPVFKLFN